MHNPPNRFPADDDAARGAGLLAWHEFERSDLVRWFGLHEVGRTALSNGWSAVHLKPGSHHEAVDIEVQIDPRQRIKRALLMMDRAWVDGGQTAKLADDLTQSFLLALAGRHPETSALASRIFSRNRGSQPIIRADDPPRPADTLIPAVMIALGAYLGSSPRAELVGPHLAIVLANDWSASHAQLTLDIADAPGAPPPASTTPPSARYDRLFLDSTDVPAGLTMTQDSRGRGPDHGDASFWKYGGIASGMAVWHGPEDAPIHRLVDVRWVFPTPEAATEYVHETMAASSEGLPLFGTDPLIGTACQVFGGSPDVLGSGDGLTAFCYLLTVGPVVVKLYAADFDGASLRAEMLYPIAQRIVQRLSADPVDTPINWDLTFRVEPAPPPRKPWWRFW
ncbi:MAG: hypothetical protein U0893_04130 [Chloroflexota bacterium]